MATSFYDMCVPSYLQTLSAVGGYLDKGLAHCKEKGMDPGQIVETRLFPDMLPFRFQIRSVVHHSLGALEGIKRGKFEPPKEPEVVPDYATLQAMVVEARDAMQKFTPEAVNGLEAKELVFQLGERQLPFTAVGFMSSFSLPNFYFHATTAYDILRSKGVPLGKRDFLGRLRMKS
jgi:hypothetical protein